MGGVRSSCWARVVVPLACAAALLSGCGRTSKSAAISQTPQAGAPNQIDPEPKPEGPNCAVALSSNGGRHCAVYIDGSVWCFGAQMAPQPADFVPSSEPLQITDAPSSARIVVGPRHSCVVNGRGEIWCWGDNESGQIDDSASPTLGPTRVAL